jgi:uncharacterized protein YeaO (DUF488 family)
MDIRLKRAYAASELSDGFRVLVDRLWPRGVTKTEASIDLWLKEVAPSTALRRWFGHAPEKWQMFHRRYCDELDQSPEAVAQLLEYVRQGRVTLVYGAKDPTYNHARVLLEYLERQAR